MTSVFVVRLYTHSGVGGTAIFSTLESAERLVARLNKHKEFIENHGSTLCQHEFMYTDRETFEKFLFSHLTYHTSVEVEKAILYG